MVKPSIFSKDYEKQMRQRKIRITILLSLLVIFIAGTVVYMKGIFKDISKSAEKAKSSITANKDQIKDAKTINAKAKDKEQVANETKEEGYDVQLTDGKVVKAVLETKNNDKVFKGVSPAESKVNYSISPSSKNLVIFDDKAQSITFLDIKGNKQDITNQQYTSTSGTVISKNDQLKAQADYVWCNSPKFIDENNIAYISQLPWIGKTTKYVWIENLQNKTHTLVTSIEGENLKLDKLTEKGLTVIADGKTLFLTSDGNVVQ